MLVRSLIGRYAGEIVDIKSDSARQMLADGRAEKPSAARQRDESQVEAPVKRRRGRPPKNRVEPDGASS